LVGMGRSQSYRAAAAGLMPVERSGKFMLVPRQRWDRKVKRLLTGHPDSNRALGEKGGRLARAARKEFYGINSQAST